jgi:tetratricopeptide (TPR) repeat protein
MKRFISILLLLMSGSVLVMAQPEDRQNAKFREDFIEANLLMKEGYYAQALDLWLQLVNEDPSNANLNYKVGRCYLESANEKRKAQRYLERAVESRSERYSSFNISYYDPYDPKERNAPVEADYYLGQSHLLNYELDGAETSFNAALDKMGSKHNLRDEAERGLEMVANAKIQLANPRMDIVIKNMGPVINGEYNDFSPVISLDENALFFTSRRLRTDSTNADLVDDTDGQFFEDIYVSYRDRNGEWQDPELLAINEPSAHSATINVSVDGQELYIYKDDEGGGDIYESALIGETWSFPEKMDSEINSSHWETHSAKSADGNAIYFVSDRPGGYGGRDIYRCVKLPNGAWSKPLLLGPEVNTEYDEDAPFIHPDGRTLYFASEGHDSMGGFDIFSSRMDNEGEWTIPQNIGYPINTVDDDVFFVTSADSRRAYFSSDRNGGKGLKDIYMVELPVPEDASSLAVLKGFVVPQEGQAIPASTAVMVTDKQEGISNLYKPRVRDGAFVAILEPCKDYQLDYMIDESSIHQEDIFVDCDLAYSEIQREVLLDPVNLRSSVVKVITPEGSITQTDEGVTQTQLNTDDVTAVITTKDNVSVISAAPKGSAMFDKYFGYNEKDIALEEARFQLFMNDIMDKIAKDGSVTVDIEGSASRVPTRTWKTNDILSNNRAQDAKELLMEALDERGIDRSKVRVNSIKGLIQGPRYKGDFETNREVYEQYQYIRIIAR